MLPGEAAGQVALQPAGGSWCGGPYVHADDRESPDSVMNTPTIPESDGAGSALCDASSAKAGVVASPAKAGDLTSPAQLGGVAVREADGITCITCRPNVALSPLQAAAVMASAGAVSLLVAAGFWMVGAPWVLPFSCIEVAVLVLAFWHLARHANDCDTVEVSAREVRVQRWRAGHAACFTLDRTRRDARAASRPDGLVELRGQGGELLLGQLLAWGERRRLSAILVRTLNQRSYAPAGNA
jgi:uncharacterized membrane protein